MSTPAASGSTVSRSHQIIQLVGILTSSSGASVRLQKQYGIPASVMQAAYKNGVWDVTAILPYIK